MKAQLLYSGGHLRRHLCAPQQVPTKSTPDVPAQPHTGPYPGFPLFFPPCSVTPAPQIISQLNCLLLSPHRRLCSQGQLKLLE